MTEPLGREANFLYMLRLRRTEIQDDPIEWSNRSVTLVSTLWVASLKTPWFGLGTTYRGPSRVETTGDNPESHPIRDHVMLAKLATGLVLITMAMNRRIRR